MKIRILALILLAVLFSAGGNGTVYWYQLFPEDSESFYHYVMELQ